MKVFRWKDISSRFALEGNVLVLASHLFVSHIGFRMFYVIWQHFILSTGLEVIDLGIIQSVLNLSITGGLVVCVTLFDRVGRKPVLLLLMFSG